MFSIDSEFDQCIKLTIFRATFPLLSSPLWLKKRAKYASCCKIIVWEGDSESHGNRLLMLWGHGQVSARFSFAACLTRDPRVKTQLNLGAPSFYDHRSFVAFSGLLVLFLFCEKKITYRMRFFLPPIVACLKLRLKYFSYTHLFIRYKMTS